MIKEEDRFDVVVVGGGTGGYVTAIRAAQRGLKVALIEQEKVGGTCLHRGCIPTKALLQSAEVYSLLRQAQDFGVGAENLRLDYPQVLRRKERIVSQLHKGVEYLLKKNGVTVVRGKGKLLSSNNVVVHNGEGERELQAANVILATGSRAKSLPGLVIDGDRVITSDHAVEMDTLPRSIVIVGAGAVGMEFASLYNALGVEVALVEWLPAVLPLEDGEVSRELATIFQKRGIKILTGARLLTESLRKHKGGVEVEVEIGKGGSNEKVKGERLLVAVGREGRVEDLGLEGLNVEVNKGFIKVDGNMRTGVPNVYAIGDVIGGLLLAHVAAAEGIRAVEDIVGGEKVELDYDRVPRCTYCSPQVASLGLSEDEARSRGFSVKVGRFPFRASGKALIQGESQGFAKVVADSTTGELLGVHLLGPHVTELIAEAALAKLLEATAWEIGSSIHAHPTLAEALGEAALAVEGLAIHF